MGTTTLVSGIYLSRPEVSGSPEFKYETADAFFERPQQEYAAVLQAFEALAEKATRYGNR